MKTLIEIEQSIQRLKAARSANAADIKELEERNEVVIVELEKALIEKGRIMATENMRRYFEEWDQF